VRIALAFPIRGAFERYKVFELGSGVLVDHAAGILVTAAHCALDPRAWTSVKSTEYFATRMPKEATECDMSDPRIFVGCYRAPNLTPRWKFECDVQSFLRAARFNVTRGGGPTAHPGNACDIAVMRICAAITLQDETPSLDASGKCGGMKLVDDTKYGGNGNFRIPVSSKEVERVGQLAVNVKERIPLDGLTDVLKHGFEPLCPMRMAEGMTKEAGVAGMKGLNLLGYPTQLHDHKKNSQHVHASIQITEVDLSHGYGAGDCKEADVNQVCFETGEISVKMVNGKGGSGGPLVDVERRCVVGVLSKSNQEWDTKIAMIAKAEDLIPVLLSKGGGGGEGGEGGAEGVGEDEEEDDEETEKEGGGGGGGGGQEEDDDEQQENDGDGAAAAPPPPRAMLRRQVTPNSPSGECRSAVWLCLQ
jgi:hypothetical protein